MTANTSQTGGPLSPSDPQVYYDTDYAVSDYTPVPGSVPMPISGAAFNKVLHDWLMGLTGLPGNMIMPRWQIIPPNIPDSTIVDWMTFGVTRKSRQGTAFVRHHSAAPSIGLPNGFDQNVRWEEFTVLCSIYGPNHDMTETAISQGMWIMQNNESLLQNQIRPIGTDEIVLVPELIKEIWIQRWDLSISMTRQVVLNYAVEDIASAIGSIETGTGTTEAINN